jgi:hypothetical protein
MESFPIFGAISGVENSYSWCKFFLFLVTGYIRTAFKQRLARFGESSVRSVPAVRVVRVVRG